MNYITVVAPTYDDAVKKARGQYGDRIRIHARRDVSTKGFLGLFGKKRYCELTCYLADDGQESANTASAPQKSADKPSRPASESDRKGGSGDSVFTDPVSAEEAKDIRRFEQEAKTPNPEAGELPPAFIEEPEDTLAAEPEVEDNIGQKPATDPRTGDSGVVDSRSAAAETVDAGLLGAGALGVKPAALDATSGNKEPEEQEDADAPLVRLLDRARELLEKNDFSDSYINWIVRDLRAQLEPALPAVPSASEFELLVVDRIVSSVEIDHNSQMHPPKVFAVLGPTGVGKTTTIAKIAAIYGTVPPKEIRRKVKIITMDSFRVGAYEQIESFGRALDIPVMRADDEQQFAQALESSSDAELILVDTIGRSPRETDLDERLRSMLNVVDRRSLKCYLAISASMKKVDIDRVIEEFSRFGICSVIVTKADETSSIGNILSICHDKRMPLLFITDGQMVPRDIHKASSAFMLGLLKGFSLDFNSLWDTQFGSDE